MTFTLSLALMAVAQLRIDHAAVAGQDLEKMRARLSAIGIANDFGGPHTNRATENAIASFPDGSYIELIAIQKNFDPARLAAHPWAKFMQGDAGPCAWAVRVADIAAEIKRIRDRGLTVTGPVESGRSRPDGVALAWKTAQVGTEGNGVFYPFLIQDVTKRPLRAEPAGHPSNKDFAGIHYIVIAVRNLDDAVERYRKAYGLERPIKQIDTEFGAHLALMGDVPVILAAPLGAQSWLARRIEQFGEAPCAFILTARKAGKYKAASKARWFGKDVSWLDAEALGWRLGFEN